MSWTYLPLLAVAAASASPEAQPTATIDRDVEQFLGVPAGAPGGAARPVDPRLRLARCPAPLTLEWYGNRRVVVLVQCPAIGWRLFVPIAQAPPAAREVLVERGDAVTVAVTAPGLSVTQQGEALESGAEGAWIRVRISGSAGRTIRGRVLGPGQVGVDLP